MKKNNLLKKNIAVLTWLFVIAFPVVCFAQLEANSLVMTIGSKTYSFTGNVNCIIEEEQGQTLISIGFEDNKQRAELLITSDCLKKNNQLIKQELSSKQNQIMFVFKTTQGSLLIMPAITLAKNNGQTFAVKTKQRGKAPVFTRKSPDWTRMSRSERIASGKGIIRNSGMENSSFSMKLNPVFAKGELVEITGSFSGVSGAKESNAPLIISNGQFRVEVKNDIK